MLPSRIRFQSSQLASYIDIVKRYRCLSILFLAALFTARWSSGAESNSDSALTLHLRSREEKPAGSGEYETVFRRVQWNPRKTAILVIDMGEKHWCQGAQRRVAEMAPQMNEFLNAARRQGVLIVYAPGGHIWAHADHPARKRAQQVPAAELPEFLRSWAPGPLEWERGIWPIDESDGGCDCQPMCRTPGQRTQQIDTLEIHNQDLISGDFDGMLETGNIFVQRGIENVMLMGIHTNMCLIGRPFGLRNLVRWGKNVVLVRDLTDTMYNPRKPPRVSHVRGTELVVEHIEKFLCPTISSTDLLKKPALRFKEDRRPHIVFLVSDDHYRADKTLPAFAQMLRQQYECHCTIAHGLGTPNITAVEELENSDLLVLYIRRLALPREQLQRIRTYLDLGKPLVALRTASHAFDVTTLNIKVPPGGAEWRTFDQEVLGGNYHGYLSSKARIEVVPQQVEHPILTGVEPGTWQSSGSLYTPSPIDKQALVLLTGSAEDGRGQQQTEPVAWTRSYRGGRVFYCSLGHWDDFAQPQFKTLLRNAIFWAMDQPLP